MTQITLNKTYDAKLKSLVNDYGQTPTSLVESLIDGELARRTSEPSGVDDPAADKDETIPLKPLNPDNLKHTRIVSAVVGESDLYKPKWSSVREEMHLLAVQKMGSVGKVKEISGANARADKYELDGYKYLPGGKFSLQGVDSNAAWTQTFKLARHLGVPVKLVVQWRDKDDAAHPGKSGLLEYSPPPGKGK